MTAGADARIEQTLQQLFDTSVAPEVRQTVFAQVREQHPDLLPRIEAAVLRRDQSQSDAIGKLSYLIDELRETNEKLTSAPLQEAVFVEPVTLADGRTLARVVATGAREALLEPMDDALLPELCAGDRVLLSTEGNLVLAKLDSPSPGPGECAQVERWIDERRLLVRHREQSTVMRATAGLSPENLKDGESVRIDALSGFASERVESDAKSPYAASDEATSLPPEALAGYDDIRDQTLRRITYAVAHPEIAARYGMKHKPWILLGGPPGLGKSTLARVVAGDLQRITGRNCKIRKVAAGELLSSWVGETEKRIRTLVREVRDGNDRSIIFLDEADAIARTRGAGGNAIHDSFLGTWLAELEGFDGRVPAIVIAATNRLDTLDAAFRSRFSTEIEFPRPRMDAARAIFAHHLPTDLPYEDADGAGAATRERLIDAAIAKLYLPNAPGALLATLRFRDGKTRPVHARDLMSGRLIEQICVDARERAFARDVERGERGLCVEDIESAADSARERLRTTLTPSNAHNYLTDLPQDVGVVAVDPAPRVRSGVTYIRQAA